MMVQKITPVSPPFFVADLLQKLRPFGVVCLALTAILWLLGASAATTLHDRLITDTALPGDTSIQASICANESYLFDGTLLTTSGIYTAHYTASDGTDSVVTLQLSVLPLSITQLSAGICEGSHYIFQGDTLTESGTYNVVLTAANGCDSTVTLKLEVVPFFDVQIRASICDGASYIFGDDTLSLPGTYVDSLIATGGCDSTVTLTLKVLPNAGSSLVAGICTGSSYIFGGDTLTDHGIYVRHLTAANGCDSTVVLNLTVVDFFEVDVEASICAGETYVFDQDTLSASGVYVANLVAAGGCDSTVTLTLKVLPLQSGTDEASICAGDTLDYNGNSLTDAGVYEFILDGANGCDSTVTFTLKVLPRAVSALEASICHGETYDFNGQVLDASGTYQSVLVAENGCDSTVTLVLSVLPTQQTTLRASICAGEVYEYLGDTLSVSGSYDYVFTGSNSCDSTVTIVLTVKPVQNIAIYRTICAGESYPFDGKNLTMPGAYEAVFTGSNGCDSTVMLVLDVLQTPMTMLDASICAGNSYLLNGENITKAGVYTAVLTAANGCDSTVILNLSVLPTQSTSLVAEICAGKAYDYYGQALTTAGAYEFTYEGANGCDSTVTLTLNVLPVAKTNVQASICEGEVYEYNGDTLSKSGNYPFVFNGSNGCDSIVTIHLVVRPLLSSERTVTLCAGDFYVLDGDTLTEAGVYTATFTGSNGCDSTETLTLAFVPSFETHLQISICSGDSFPFDGEDLTAAGNYSMTLTASGGCDSIVNLALTVLPLSKSSTDASICAGESYEFNGQILELSGIYTATLPGAGANGCDSTAILNLTVRPVQTTSLAVSICANETFLFNGQALSQSGTYTAQWTAENGCDSTVTLDLAVLPLAQSAFAATVCGGVPYNYQGEVLTESGTYEFIFGGEAANGCDSIVTLYLTIFPAIAPTNISADICDGQSYDFYGAPLTAAGTYSVDFASQTGCDSTIILTLSVLPNPVTHLSATICEGAVYAFNGLALSVAGDYTVVLPSAAGCDSTVHLTLIVNKVDTEVALQGSTITAQAANAAFQWINCATNQPIAGATGSTFQPATSGNYAVVVTQNGCTATSICVFVQIVSVSELIEASAWRVQPNPTRQYAQVVFQQTVQEDILLEIYDSAGRLLRSQRIAPHTLQVDLDLNDLPDGWLLLRLATANTVSAKRMLKTAN